MQGAEFIMPILALDTSTLVSSVAVATPDALLAELTLQVRKTHSERLLPHIESLLAMAELDVKKLKAVAVSLGPGSFTGLRIGLATAKGLSYALKIPLLGVPTLTALAFSCPVAGSYLSPMLDAQKGNVYQAVFCWQDNELQEIIPPRVISFEKAYQELLKMPKPFVILGEAALLYREKIASPAPCHITMPRAGSVATLAQKMLAQGETQDIFTLEPLYIRRSEAEEIWERRNCVNFAQQETT
jgi:tRNA threonylcarbamoyladenosine biosynthesis protein TsaB